MHFMTSLKSFYSDILRSLKVPVAGVDAAEAAGVEAVGVLVGSERLNPPPWLAAAPDPPANENPPDEASVDAGAVDEKSPPAHYTCKYYNMLIHMR